MLLFFEFFALFNCREPTPEERLHFDLEEYYYKDVSPLLVLPKNTSIDSKEYREEVCAEWIPKILENFDENVDAENTLSHIFYCVDAVDGFDELEACDEWLDYIHFKNLRSTSYKGKCEVHDEHYLERKQSASLGKVGDFGMHDDASANEIVILNDIINRPLYDHVIDVDLYIELDTINEIDLRDALMDVTFTMYADWYDSRLEWNKTEYSGVMYTVFDTSKIWTPPIEVMNLLKMINPKLESLCEVHHDGTVHEIIKMRALVSCNVDQNLYPFDTQECGLNFATPSMADYKLYFHLHKWNMLNNLGNLSASIANYEEVHLSVLKGSFYEKNQEWDLLGYKYESGTVVGHLKRSYSLVRVYFLLERHTVYYEVTLFIPIVCINLLVCLGLWMPISCGEAAGFQVTLLLALILYLDLISTTTPVFDSIGKSPRLLILFLITTIASVVAHIIITFSMWKQSCDDDTLRNLSSFKCKFTQKTAKVLEWLTREKYDIPKAIQLIIDDAENIEKLEEEELKKAWKFYGKMSSHFWAFLLTFAVIFCTFVIIADLHIERIIFDSNLEKSMQKGQY